MPYRSLKPLLFRLEPEQAHDLTMIALRVASHFPLDCMRRQMLRPEVSQTLTQTLWGREFASPVGLAAGLDKNGQAVLALSALGFGFVEVGTVTPLAQAGNPRPRLFRLPEDEALINRMGFNNLGAEHLFQQLQRLEASRSAPVWVNIGKNKTTEHAAEDYVRNIRVLQEVADAFVINVSSPNTPGLRALQSGEELTVLVRAVLDEVEAGRVRTLNRPPVLVKLAPDLSDEAFEESVLAATEAGAQGLIISNTTLSREGLTHRYASESGGLSGRPLRIRSTELLAKAYQLVGKRVPLVGVGGIFSAEDAYEKIQAGASLVEIYSGLIYKGPEIVKEINEGLNQYLQRDGFKNITEARGSYEKS